jgi:hypothetical protein
VPDDRGTLFTERSHEADDVPGELEHVVRLDRPGTVRLTEAALIRRNHAITRGGKRTELVPPRVP